MEKIGMEVVNNLQLLIQSKNGMSTSIRKRGGKGVGGLNDYPSEVRSLVNDLPAVFKVKEGWKLGYSDISLNLRLDLSDVTDGVNLFRNCAFEDDEEKFWGHTIDISNLQDCSYMMYNAIGRDQRYSTCVVEFIGGENITKMDYTCAKMGRSLRGDNFVEYRDIMVLFDYKKVKPTSMICTFENSEIYGSGDGNLWFTVNTENVEDFTGCYRDSICGTDVYVNISNATHIDEMFMGCKKEFDIYFFGDPSKLESMVDAFDIGRYDRELPKPIFKYDYRYDYSHVLEEVRKSDELDIQPMSSEELERFLNIFPSWRYENN